MATPCFIEVTRNDTKFSLDFTVEQPDGTPVDLTNSTIKFKAAALGASVLKIDGTCAITDAVNGLCSYEFVSGDLDTEGDFDAELEITYASGEIRTAKLDRMRVSPDLPV